jgi:hypothetical protein
MTFKTLSSALTDHIHFLRDRGRSHYPRAQADFVFVVLADFLLVTFVLFVAALIFAGVSSPLPELVGAAILLELFLLVTCAFAEKHAKRGNSSSAR